MAAFTELFIDQGATFNSVITLSDDVTNADVNVAGYTIRSQMRRSYYSANATANLTCTITSPAGGVITLSLTAGETANIKSGRYLFDVQMVSDVGQTTRILEGIITVNPRVTQ